MKVAIATFTFSPERNGVANVCALQTKSLIELGHRVSVLTSINSRNIHDELMDNARVRRFHIIGTGAPHLPVKGEVSNFLKFIDIEQFDVIFVHCWQAWPIKLLSKCSMGKTKLVFFSHGTSVNTVYDWKTAIYKLLWLPYRYLFMPKAFNKFAAFVHLSAKKDNDRFLDNKLCPEHIVHEVISNCVNHIEYKYQTNADHSCFTLLVVGGYSRLKNELFVLRQLIAMDIPCKINFVGYKANAYSEIMQNEYDHYCQKYAGKTLSPQIQVQFHYELCELDILALYESSDLCVSASKTECQPLVILQAMAYGIPFLSSDVGCVSELPGGFVYKSKHDFRQLLAVLYQDFNSGKLKLMELSNAGYQFSIAELSVDRYTERLNSLLHKVGVKS